MKKSMFGVIFTVLLTNAMILANVITIPGAYSSPESDTADQQQQEPSNDKPVVEPEPSPEPEPMDEVTPDQLNDGTLIEKEKECSIGEYDNGGKCAKIPECTLPETWSAMEQKCRIFPWWQVLR